MCKSISLLGMSNVSRIQWIPFVNTENLSSLTKENVISPKSTGEKICISEMAQFIKIVKGNDALPTFKQIMEKFDNGELDPRKLKKGDEITLNLQGKDYKFKIEKDGEFTCKVQGRDDFVRIYVGKNAFGQDCACFLRRYKKEECNLYVNYYKKIPLDKYDKKIKNQTK